MIERFVICTIVFILGYFSGLAVNVSKAATKPVSYYQANEDYLKSHPKLAGQLAREAQKVTK